MTASAQSLHVLAHRAGLRHRDGEDWWGSAIETALAAVSASRHPPSQREQADRALDRLDRWFRAGGPRPVSADAVALALAARAAATLARGDRHLLEAAIAAVDTMAERGVEVVPELHVALAVWAIDDLVADRERAPWPALRDRLDRGSVYGLDAALRSYAGAIAGRSFNATGLVQSLIAQAPPSPALTDGSTVLWLLGAAIDRLTRALPAEEPGLRALIDRRAAMTERLAAELDDDAFRTPRLEDLDPEAPGTTDPPPVYLSPMEALLLDIALAPDEPEASWLTFDQAEALMGRRARDAQLEAARERRRTALALATAAALAGCLLAVGLLLVHITVAIAVAWGATLGLAGITVATAVAHSVAARRRITGAAGVGAATAALCAGLNAVNQMLAAPLLSDATGLIAGASITSVAAAIWAVLSDRSGSPRPNEH